MFKGWPQFDETTTIWEAMKQVEGFVGEAVPVVGENGQLVGMISEANLIVAYLEIVHELRKEENAAV